jgi:hypothetical protein
MFFCFQNSNKPQKTNLIPNYYFPLPRTPTHKQSRVTLSLKRAKIAGRLRNCGISSDQKGIGLTMWLEDGLSCRILEFISFFFSKMIHVGFLFCEKLFIVWS